MKRCNTVELRQREIINLCDGAMLGNPTDFEFDPCSGQICSLIICKDRGFLGFGKKELTVIPWKSIECFGEDTILVRIPPNELIVEERKM